MPKRPEEKGQPNSAEFSVLAERTQWLFENKRRPDGERYSLRDVSREAKQLGLNLSPAYLSRLVNGHAANPTMEVLTALGRIFDVEFSYFDPNEPAEAVQARIKLAEKLKDSGVEKIAMRSVGLPPKQVEVILGMIDRVREVEGLPPADDPSDESA